MKSSSQLHHQHHQHPYQQPQAQPQAQHQPFNHKLLQQQRHQQLREPPSGLNGLASGDSMSDRLGLGPEVRELKLGSTFFSDKTSTAFHTIKYDFKPASVDTSKMAMVEVGNNNTTTVTVPHLDGAGVPHTVFKGSQRPYTKECVLIIDNVTGEITLERLSSNIQVKKTRSQTSKTQSLLSLNSHSGIRPITPIDTRKSPTHRTKSRTKVTSGKKREPSHQLCPKQSPQRASYHGKSPPMKSPSSSSNSNINCSAMPSSSQSLGSLPIIGDSDDFPLSFPVPAPVPVAAPAVTAAAAAASSTAAPHSSAPPRTRSPAASERPPAKAPLLDNEVGILSDSSSSESSSDSSDSESEPEKSSSAKVNGHEANGAKTSPPLSMPDVLLSEDLQLSESESDSD